MQNTQVQQQPTRSGEQVNTSVLGARSQATTISEAIGQKPTDPHARNLFLQNKVRNKVRSIKESIAGGRRAYYALSPERQAEIHNAAWVLFEAGITAGNAEKKENLVKEGFVYVITNPSFPGYVKVGCAMNVERRLEGFNTGDPHRAYQVAHKVFSSNRAGAESFCHWRLNHCRVAGEWFKCTPSEARLVLQSVDEAVA